MASTKRIPAFISAGFPYWKEAVTVFKKHTGSACHREAVEVIELLPRQVMDIGKLCDSSTQRDKAANRAMFKCILQNLGFLACQGLTFRGHDSGVDSNFTQLLQLRAYNCPEILTWIAEKTNKYTLAGM